MKKRFAALLAAAMLLFSMPALAESEDTVASIGSVGYPSVRAAVLAASDGETVTVTKDHEMNCADAAALETLLSRWSIVNVSGKTVTLDLNGKHLTASPTFDINVFSAENRGDLIIVDSVGGGSVDVTAATPIHSLMLTYDEVSKAQGAATLTVNGGSFRLNQASSGLFYAQKSETIIVNGGTFVLDNVASGSNGIPAIFNISGKNTGYAIVNGGSFNCNVARQHWIFEANTAADMSMQQSGGMYTMVPAKAYVVERIYADAWRSHPYGYTDLLDAVRAAKGTQLDSASNSWSGPENVVLVSTCEVDEPLVFTASNALLLKAPARAAANTVKWTGNDTDPLITVASGTDADGAPIFLTVEDFVPLRDGYVFDGWYSDAARTAAYDLAAKGGVEGGTSLYAKWTEEAPAPTPEPSPAPETGDPAQPLLLAGMIPLAVLALIGKKRVCG